MESKIRESIKGCFLSEISKDESLTCNIPKNMLMEVTNFCNHSCLFCANSKCTKPRGFIDSNLAKKILKDAYMLGTREVGFYGTGEPLLNRELESHISYAKELGYEYTYITTNGALLTEERAKSLLEAGIDSIKFSINASNREDYYLIHGKDDFDTVIENLVCVDSMRKRLNKKVALYVSHIATRYTDKDQGPLKEKILKYVDDILFLDCRNIAGCMANEIKDYLSVDEKMGLHPQNGVCPLIFKKFHVTYEGYLTMCCADFQNYLVIADLSKENLGDAWNNEHACSLRKKHLSHNLEGTLCFNCVYDCAESIEPIRRELATEYQSQIWDKRTEIAKRVQAWRNGGRVHD